MELLEIAKTHDFKTIKTVLETCGRCEGTGQAILEMLCDESTGICLPSKTEFCTSCNGTGIKRELALEFKHKPI